jgi:outer membrane lipoprotein LolB
VLPTGAERVPERPARAGIAAFAIDGRIAVRHEDRRHRAGIAWRHTAAADEILLTGPLGQGVAELSRDARGARLVTADKEVVEAEDWEALSQRVFGFALPLAGMPRWLVGDLPAASRDALGRPQAAITHGWEIRYLDYESDRADALPALIEFRRGDTDMRLKIDSWQLD